MLALVEARVGRMPEDGELNQFWVPVGPKPHLLVADSQMRAAALAWRIGLDTRLWFPAGLDNALTGYRFDLVVVMPELERPEPAVLNHLSARQAPWGQTVIYDRMHDAEGDWPEGGPQSYMELARDFRDTLKRHGVKRY